MAVGLVPRASGRHIGKIGPMAQRRSAGQLDLGPAVIPSKSQVNKAAFALAAARRGEVSLSAAEQLEAARVVDAWRQLHAEPLGWVTQAVGRRLAPVIDQLVVAQRLKRMPQIIKKIARYQDMKLARMQDLGGCRVVLPDPSSVTLASERLRSYGTQYWAVRHEADYRDAGRPDTAYRALHLTVVREDRQIEIQLRTFRQHAWAEAVERVTALSDHDVKEGRAPEDFLEYFRLASDAFWRMDCKKSISRPVRQRFRALHRDLGRFVMPPPVAT